jgi:hypothetical protein
MRKNCNILGICLEWLRVDVKISLPRIRARDSYTNNCDNLNDRPKHTQRHSRPPSTKNQSPSYSLPTLLPLQRTWNGPTKLQARQGTSLKTQGTPRVRISFVPSIHSAPLTVSHFCAA